MSVGRERKDPGATETFGLDWSADLATGDTINTSAWTFETAEGLATDALTQTAASKTTLTTQIRVTGGTNGATYYLVNTIVTANGDTLVRRLLLDCDRE